METKDKIDRLQALAEGAIERLRRLPQPVVRVSGPITSGGATAERTHFVENGLLVEQISGEWFL